MSHQKLHHQEQALEDQGGRHQHEVEVVVGNIDQSLHNMEER
jgi:hypothetical protein